MTSSRWHAHGNVYLVAENDEYTMEPGLDGVVRVLEVAGDDVQIAIVNPDGSLAEMSGNGTRIAAAWLIARTGSTLAASFTLALTLNCRSVSVPAIFSARKSI